MDEFKTQEYAESIPKESLIQFEYGSIIESDSIVICDSTAFNKFVYELGSGDAENFKSLGSKFIHNPYLSALANNVKGVYYIIPLN